MTRCVLGDVTFDPVATQDFRLSVEGTSKTGKSNTIAVILEDLAETRLPTLVVERLGALSPVRFEDESLVVVGARDEEGIDLAVALGDLDQIGSWVLDRGLKVLVDISTYADYESEDSRVHLAAATAIRSLNDRAHEKYRAGDRTQSLLVADEAHILAPKDGAPEPDLDDYVRRCRGQLIKAATEGGNKGISIVVGYQRRAFLHNGVIQLCDDYIAHKPGEEDIARTADALRCSEDDLADLDQGEILARGQSITDGELVGPTKVRKRRSPDPREETFELPETTGELAETLDDIQSEVEAERERREERQDELEQLREENERLRDRVDDLEQELADTDRLASALKNLQSGGNGGAAQDVGEGVTNLQGRVGELKDERDALAEELDEVRAERETLAEERDELQGRVDDLEAEVQDLRTAFDSATDHVVALAETFDADAVDLESSSPAPSGSVSEPDSTSVGVQETVLSAFAREGVERLVDRAGSLSASQRRLLTFIESRGQTIDSQKAWAQAALGLSSTPNSSHYDAMGELIDDGWVGKNKNGSVKPNLRGRVASELDEYDVEDDVVEDAYERVLKTLAEQADLNGGGHDE